MSPPRALVGLVVLALAVGCDPLVEPGADAGCPRPCPAACAAACLPTGYCAEVVQPPPAEWVESGLEVGTTIVTTISGLPPAETVAYDLRLGVDVAGRGDGEPGSWGIELRVDGRTLTDFHDEAPIGWPKWGRWTGAVTVDADGLLRLAFYARCQLDGRAAPCRLDAASTFQARVVDDRRWSEAPPCEL